MSEHQTHHGTTGHRAGFARTAVQKAALTIGILFLLVGIAGFVPGLTHSLDHLEGAGTGSEAMLLGVFQVSLLHNAVHLLFGILGIAAAAGMGFSRQYLLWGGVVYLALLVYGLFAVNVPAANFVPVNAADNWLHLGLGVGMILLGMLLTPSRLQAASSRASQ